MGRCCRGGIIRERNALMSVATPPLLCFSAQKKYKFRGLYRRKFIGYMRESQVKMVEEGLTHIDKKEYINILFKIVCTTIHTTKRYVLLMQSYLLSV